MSYACTPTWSPRLRQSDAKKRLATIKISLTRAPRSLHLTREHNARAIRGRTGSLPRFDSTAAAPTELAGNPVAQKCQPPPPANQAARSAAEWGSSRGAVGGGVVAVPVGFIGARPTRATTHSPSRWVAIQVALGSDAFLRLASAIASSCVIAQMVNANTWSRASFPRRASLWLRRKPGSTRSSLTQPWNGWNSTSALSRPGMQVVRAAQLSADASPPPLARRC
jgi:hypothetical protein